MRWLCLTLLCGLVAVPAAFADARTAGDGVLELRAVYGTVAIAGKGALWGQLDRGKLVATDPIAGDGDVYVSGCEIKRPGLAEHTTVCIGKDLHFRITGGRYKLWFNGVAPDLAAGLDLTAVGVGKATVIGDVFAGDTGDYAVDDGNWLPVPFKATVVPFGVQPTVTPPTTP